MRALSSIAILALAGFSLGWQAGSEAGKLVRDLGSASFEEREKATKDLEALGEKALVELKKGEKSEDAEIRRRAGELVKIIETRLENSKLTQPTIVKLNHKDIPLEDVIADLVKQSGYRIVLQDRTGKSGKKKISLSAQSVPFWEALDLVCKAGELVEAAVPLAGIEPSIGIIELDAVPLPIPPRRAIPAPPPVIEEKKEQTNRKSTGAVLVALAQDKVKPQGKEDVPGLPKAIGPLPPVAGGIRRLPDVAPGGNPLRANIIALTPGKRESLPTDTHSAYRVRVLKEPEKLFGKNSSDKILIGIEVTPEPRVKLNRINKVMVSKAMDDKGQFLSHEADLNNPNDPVAPLPINARGQVIIRPLPAIGLDQRHGLQRIPIYFTRGEKESKRIVSLKGALVLEVQSEEQTFLEANLAKAGNKKVNGKAGGWLKVSEFKKEANGSHKVKFEWENPPEVTPMTGSTLAEGFGGGVQIVPLPAPLIPQKGFAFQPAPPPAPIQPQIQIQLNNMVIAMETAGTGSYIQGFTVLDSEGKPLRATSTSSRFQQGPGGAFRELTLLFPKGAGTPSSLIFKGRKSHTVEVPFSLTEIHLEK